MKTTKLLTTLSMLLILSATAIAQTTTVSGKITDENGEALPFANVALFQAADTTALVTGTATDMDGVYELTDVAAGQYLLQASYLGYRTQNINVTLTGRTLTQDIQMQPDYQTLGEVVVRGDRGTHAIDRTTFTFTEEQKAQAQDLRDLVSTLPNLLVDPTSNALSTINGKSVLVLLNGMRASNEDIQLIPADKIKSVEYYDVPPIRYMNNAEIVVNIHTKPLDTGWSGNVYVGTGNWFHTGNVAISRVKGNNKLTLAYNGQINPKLHEKDTDEGLYEYSVNSTPYTYSYLKQSRDWNHQHGVSLTYSNSKDEDYEFQIKGSAEFDRFDYYASRQISMTVGSNRDDHTGYIDDRIKTFSPTVDVYFNKYFNNGSTFTVDVLGTYFNNRQRTHSVEEGTYGYDDPLRLNTKKKSLIGEMLYSGKLGKANLTLGYRGTFNFLNNETQNSVSGGKSSSDIDTQKHYLYGEVNGRLNKFMYRLSLGGTYDRKSGSNGYDNVTFTPVAMVGYRFSGNNSLRLMYTSGTTVPDIQQMSDTRILVMNDFYQTGNTQLQNSHEQKLSLRYSLTTDFVSVDATAFYEHNGNALFNNYVYAADGSVLLQADNADKSERRGGSLDLDINPWKFLRIGTSVELSQAVFKPTPNDKTYHYWTHPISAYVRFRLKNFTARYYQTFGSTYLDGLYKTGLEKVSYLSASYRIKNVSLGLNYYFPFIKDKVENSTISQSLVDHSNRLHMKTKDHRLLFTLSWSFNAGHSKDVYQNIENMDTDKGTFNVK